MIAVVKIHPRRFIARLLVFSSLALIPATAALTAGEVTIGEEIEAAKEALRAEPENLDNIIALAGLHARRGWKVDCYWIDKLYLDTVENNPDEPGRDSKFAGFFQECHGRREFATELARRALRSSPEDPRALMVIAEQERGPEAIGILKRIVELDPENARAYLRLGELTHRTGDYRKAIEYLERAAELAPDEDERLRRDIANRQQDANKIAELEERFAEGILEWEEYQYLARYYNQHFGGYEANLDRVQEVLQTASKNIAEPWEAHRLLGWMLNDNKQYDQAAEQYREAIRLARENADTVSESRISYLNQSLGDIYRDMGRLEDALEAYNNALNYRTSNRNLFKEVGDIYFRRGEYERAEAAYLFSEDPIRQAIVYRALDKHPQALSVLWAEIKKEPERTTRTTRPKAGIAVDRDGKPARGIWYKADYKLYLELGKTYREMGQPGKALAAYWESLKVRHSREADEAIEELFGRSIEPEL
jgi:tetratricopeptide (TPR) repeat protein